MKRLTMFGSSPRSAGMDSMYFLRSRSRNSNTRKSLFDSEWTILYKDTI